jgi:hypothetical protein
MRLPTLFSATCLACALTVPVLAQQNQELRDEIRRIVREEVRAALRDAMREIHGQPQAGRPGATPPRMDMVEAIDEPGPMRPMQRRGVQLPPAGAVRPEVRELENEIRELEATLEKLQAEIGRKVGQPHAQPGGRLELQDGNVPIEIRLEGGDGSQLHFTTPKAGQRKIEMREEEEGEEGERAEKGKKTRAIKLTPKQGQKVEVREEEEEEEAERAEKAEKAQKVEKKEKAEKKVEKKKSADAATR